VVAALEHTRRHLDAPLAFRATGIARYPGELESAVYYCCLVAIQNATKQGGPDVRISVALSEDEDELRFEVADDGTGFDPSDAHGGAGLENIRDRVGALDGRVSIVSAIGDGTVVTGSIPLPGDDAGVEPSETTRRFTRARRRSQR
jgi:signal transduction histidine kinase